MNESIMLLSSMSAAAQAGNFCSSSSSSSNSNSNSSINDSIIMNNDFDSSTRSTAEQQQQQEGKRNSSFPMKLLSMLDEAEENGWTEIVSWEMNGTAFRVHKPDDFVSLVMPQYFNQTKYKSFQRQLNLYGFARVTRGPDKGCYIHELFTRDDRDQCREIIRKKVSDDDDAGVDMTPNWLPASLAVEPDPIDEKSKSQAVAAVSTAPVILASSSSACITNPTTFFQPNSFGVNGACGSVGGVGCGSNMMDAFENYFQQNIVKNYSSSNTSDDLKKKKSCSVSTKPPENALQRMLDSYLDPVGESSPNTEDNQAEDGSSPDEPGRKKYQRAAVFPDKLHDMLEYVEQEGLEYIASWEMDGRAFKVHKIDGFMKKVMPLFFKQSKYESLQRQLNLYGFTRIPKGPMKGCYHHPLFVRGGRALSNGMARRRLEDDIIAFPQAQASAHIKAMKKEKVNVIPSSAPAESNNRNSTSSNNVSNAMSIQIEDDDLFLEPDPIPSVNNCVGPAAIDKVNMEFNSMRNFSGSNNNNNTSPSIATPSIGASSMFEDDFFKSLGRCNNNNNNINNNNMFAALPWAQPNPVASNNNTQMPSFTGISNNNNNNNGSPWLFGFVPTVTNFDM